MLSDISSLKLNPISKYEFERLLKVNMPELLDRFSQSKDLIIKMADIVLETVAHAEFQVKKEEHVNEWSSIIKIWNVIGFVLLASLDLKIYLELMCMSKDNMQKIAITRMVYTQLYEIAKNLDDLTNIRFVEEMKKINANQYIAELYEKRKMLSDLKRRYEKDLFSVRVNIGAHREKNYQVFHQYLCSMDYTASIQLVFMFNEVIDALGETLQKIMNQSVGFIKDTYNGKEI